MPHRERQRGFPKTWTYCTLRRVFSYTDQNIPEGYLHSPWYVTSWSYHPTHPLRWSSSRGGSPPWTVYRISLLVLWVYPVIQGSYLPCFIRYLRAVSYKMSADIPPSERDHCSQVACDKRYWVELYSGTWFSSLRIVIVYSPWLLTSRYWSLRSSYRHSHDWETLRYSAWALAYAWYDRLSVSRMW